MQQIFILSLYTLHTITVLGGHEYYDHECALSQETDVLHSDIIGKNICLSIKRWWQDLFLLSYNDKRAGIFYSSSEAMRAERARQYRHYRTIIHPLSKIRNFWDGLILFVLIANRVTFKHNISFIFDQFTICFYYIGVVFEFLLLLDIYVNLKTGYIDYNARICILDRKTSIIHYCSTKFFGHVVGTFPLQLMLFLRYGSNVDCSLCKANMFIIFLQVLDCLSMYRLYDATSYWTREINSYKKMYFYRCLRICILGLAAMQYFHNLTDAITVFALIKNQSIDAAAHINIILAIKYLNLLSDKVLFYIEFMRVCKSLFLFGFGFIINDYYIDRMSSVIGYLIGNAFFFSIVVEIYAYFSRCIYPENRLYLNENMIVNMIRCRQLPDKIKCKINQYYDYNMIKLVMVEKQNGLYRTLPPYLKKEIKLHEYIRHIMRIPYFLEWPIKMMEDFALMLKEEIYLRNDIVAETWTQGEGLVIIDTGVMAVFSMRHEETGHLIDGDCFGELSLVTDREVRLSNVIAVTPCKALVLLKSHFRQYMRNYPEVFFALKNQLREKYKHSQEIE